MAAHECVLLLLYTLQYTYTCSCFQRPVPGILPEQPPHRIKLFLEPAAHRQQDVHLPTTTIHITRTHASHS